jgi:hypothetical protein
MLRELADMVDKEKTRKKERTRKKTDPGKTKTSKPSLLDRSTDWELRVDLDRKPL